MFRGLHRLIKWAVHGDNYGVKAPRLFTSYELKLLTALTVLAGALLWSLARHAGPEGLLGVALVGGLALYLSYTKYYRTYRPAMDRWGIRELCSPEHPREEYRVACRDLEISSDEVKLIARQHGVNVVCHNAPENPNIQIYELEKHYEHKLFAEKWHSRFKDK